mgnify:CR=1 FL=1
MNPKLRDRVALKLASGALAAVLVLGALVASIVNDAFGLVAMEYTVDPATATGASRTSAHRPVRLSNHISSC